MIETVGDDTRQSIVLAGDAGVGKTRLAAEFVDRVASRGMAVARVTASRSAATIPLGAFAPLLPPVEELPPSRVALLQAAARAVAAREPEKPLVLMVDDAHLLDDASATLVHQLAQMSALSVVATIRAGEPAPDPVVLLWKDGWAARLDVQPLSRREVGDLLENVLAGPLDGSAVRLFWDLSGGNPLYLQELVRAAAQSESLVKRGSLWSLNGQLSAPPRLVELIELRLGDLERAERAALDFLAVADCMGLSAFNSHVGHNAVAAIEARGLISVTDDGRRRTVTLSHPLYGEVLRAQLRTNTRQALSQEVAHLLESFGLRRATDLAAAATLRLSADDAGDARLLAEAAERAYFAYDAAAAERLARAAIAAGAESPTRRLLAEVLRWQGRFSEALDVVDAIASSEANDDEHALALLTKAEILFRGLGRASDATQLLRAAETHTGTPWCDEMTATRAIYAMLQGRVVDALSVATPVLSSCDGRAFLVASIAASPALTIAGRGEDAIDIAERALPVAFSLGAQPMLADPAVHMVAKCTALIELGRLGEAMSLVEPGYEWSLANGIHVGQAWFAMLLGRIALGQGALVRADRCFQEAAITFDELGDLGLERWSLAGLAQARAARRDVVGASGALARLDQMPSPIALMEVEIERARASAEAARGATSSAVAILRSAVSLAEREGRLTHALSACHDLVRFGEPGAAIDTVRRLGAVQGPFANVRRDHVEAAAASDARSLEACSTRFDDLGYALLAAEASAQAADVYATEGRKRSSQAASAHALTLADRCEGPATPALLRVEGPAPLTAREREIAVLAAEGLAAREIAAHLVISQRTVENHLHRAYTKLGVSSRSGLAGRLRR